MSLHTLMFGWEYPPHHLGGLGVACQGLVRGLLKNDVRITMVLPHANAQENNVDMRYPSETVFDSIKVCSLLNPYDTHKTYADRTWQIPQDMQEIYGQDLGQAIEHYTAASVEMTKDVDADVIHCHDWMTYEAGARAARHHNKPLIAHIHATELDRTNFQPNEWIYKRERGGFENADKVIAVSNYTKNILVSHYGINPNKIAVVHNGNMDNHLCSTPLLTSEHRSNDRPMVLFLGRLTMQKGTHQFLDMAANVHVHRPDTLFVIAGAGDMYGELIEHACKIGLQDTVIFAGKVSALEARKLYSQASCFVMPSISEPFGLVALEAISHGTPVVLSKQSGVSEVVEHGFKVDYWDTEKMADCVLTILRDQTLTDQLRSEASRSLQRLSWQNQASNVKSIYEQTIQACSNVF